MLEVVFGDGAAGSMSAAIGWTEPVLTASCSVISITKRTGPELSRAELRREQAEAEERRRREQRSWAEAVPLEGSDRDIFSFDLLLSTGAIDEDGVGPARKSVLCALYPEWADQMEKRAEEGQRNLSVLLERAEKGESIRVWSSSNPDDACGLYWLMDQLRPVGLEKPDITIVRLPVFQEMPDGTVVQYAGWGEVEPYQFGRLALLGEKLPVNAMRVMADHWKQLRQENAPLRAVLNGRVVSAPESLYDPYILREIAVQEREFKGAMVVGSVLGNYQLGIGDGWVARRMEQFIRDGLIEPVTPAEKDRPSYHRIFRKCGSVS